MADAGEFPFHGLVIWLTPEQGGRKTGPPVPGSAWPYYAVTAYVPPRTADTGLASFILRNFHAGAWRSYAEGCWLVADVHGNQVVQPGSIITVTEGARVVAYFTVQHVADS